MSHYDYLEQHFEAFYKKAFAAEPHHYFVPVIHASALIEAHGDKCTQYQDLWSEAGLSFEHGTMIYLLTYLYPWSNNVRETLLGWISPSQWVVDNAKRFMPYLPTPLDQVAPVNNDKEEALKLTEDLPAEYQEQLRLYLRRLANEPAPARLKVLSVEPDPTQGKQAITIKVSVQPWGPDDPIWRYVEDSHERLD